MCVRAILIFSALSLLPAPATAQENDPQKPRADNCRALPDQPPAASDHEEEDPPAGQDTLSKKLDDCNGVLKPPPTGDSDIAEPPPEGGKTPIIRPEDLPQQQEQK